MQATALWGQLGQRAPRQPLDDRGPPASTTEVLRRRLEEGDATAEALRAHAGLVSQRMVWGLLKADMVKGRVKRVAGCFHLVEDWELQTELARAIELLKAYGYVVTKRKGPHA